MWRATQNWLLRNRPFLVYVPALIVSAGWALTRGGVLSSRLVLFACAGLALWTLMEWGLHRAMHVETGIGLIDRIQDTAHLRHHREPDDLEHSVIRLSASIPLATLILLMLRAVLGDWLGSLAMLWGVLAGYLLYEFVHLSAHGPSRVPGLNFLRAYHLRHHFGQKDRCFGVTSPLWDWAFGTSPRARCAVDK